MDVQYQRGTLQTKGACLCQPISWSMAAILCNSVVIVVITVFERTRPRAIPLAMITMRKSIHGFPFLCYMSMGLSLAALWATGALLKTVTVTLLIVHNWITSLSSSQLAKLSCVINSIF